MEDFLQRFAEATPNMNAEDLSPETVYRELPVWDSLTYLSLLAIVEETYGVVLTAFDLRKHQTIRALYEYIQTKR